MVDDSATLSKISLRIYAVFHHNVIKKANSPDCAVKTTLKSILRSIKALKNRLDEFPHSIVKVSSLQLVWRAQSPSNRGIREGPSIRELPPTM